MSPGEGGELSGRIRAVLAGCDESDPRYPVYATFLQELHVALRHAAGRRSATIAAQIRRWQGRGLCAKVLRRLAAALADIPQRASHGQEH